MPTVKPSLSSHDHGAVSQDRLKLFLSGAVVCWAIWLTQTPEYGPGYDGAIHAGTLTNKININTDPWWRVTALPNIGMVKAKRIIAFRERSEKPQPFAEASDLQQIHGIGPKTVAEIAPLLSFDMDDQPVPVDVRAASHRST